MGAGISAVSINKGYDVLQLEKERFKRKPGEIVGSFEFTLTHNTFEKLGVCFIARLLPVRFHTTNL